MNIYSEALAAGLTALSTLAGAADPKPNETACDAFDTSAKQGVMLNNALDEMGAANSEIQNIIREATGLENPLLNMTLDEMNNPEMRTSEQELQLSAYTATYESVLSAQGVDPVEFSKTYADLAETAQEIGMDTSVHKAACHAYYAEAVGEAVSKVGNSLGETQGQVVTAFTPD